MTNKAIEELIWLQSAFVSQLGVAGGWDLCDEKKSCFVESLRATSKEYPPTCVLCLVLPIMRAFIFDTASLRGDNVIVARRWTYGLSHG
jgi:hypothetical protein